ncbi:MULTISPECIES: hypothetical protein [unclassified Pseudomonas]|uniref:hypothetical protein n=1 Tax=unclassified Pseudomonas TaxID=196821 RepID=UPI000D98BF5D|nr:MULTISPECIES: hypothetical protein [unclassified Pseudomonas]PYG73419.1 hypothetical protein N428_05056 [Pseudomonas sp. RV120224-01c]PYG77811.1 hypothetical protein N436_04940 [Pseudomonas sp. RV120224-01b]
MSNNPKKNHLTQLPPPVEEVKYSLSFSNEQSEAPKDIENAGIQSPYGNEKLKPGKSPTLNLQLPHEYVYAVFKYPGHSAVPNLKSCYVTIYSRTNNRTSFQEFRVGLGSSAEPGEFGLKLVDGHFGTEATPAYKLVYEFNDGRKEEHEKVSETYKVVR